MPYVTDNDTKTTKSRIRVYSQTRGGRAFVPYISQPLSRKMRTTPLHVIFGAWSKIWDSLSIHLGQMVSLCTMSDLVTTSCFSFFFLFLLPLTFRPHSHVSYHMYACPKGLADPTSTALSGLIPCAPPLPFTFPQADIRTARKYCRNCQYITWHLSKGVFLFSCFFFGENENIEQSHTSKWSCDEECAELQVKCHVLARLGLWISLRLWSVWIPQNNYSRQAF